MKKPKRVGAPQKDKFRECVKDIARMGHGLKENSIDWSNIGKNAVRLAKQTEAGRCECCGRERVWQP